MPLGDFDLREPPLTAYCAALDSAAARGRAEAVDIALSDEGVDGSFDAMGASTSGGLVTVPGIDDYEGWRLTGYADGPRDRGMHLWGPPAPGERHGPVVGFVKPNRDGTWLACHDGFNHRPGVGAGCTGSRTTHPSAEAAYRHVVVSQRRHVARYGR